MPKALRINKVYTHMENKAIRLSRQIRYSVNFIFAWLLKRMLSFLGQAIDKLYQVIDAIYLPSG